ncbi:hypothetical protein BCV70DRAFT_88789 [Testicularia cyperi]|uniref:Uncharacterized protein n=1 Tax=Testicularia cyperi TaxID=1882483 RepID=A0A317XRV3_9BASI|nr:hypothetical protein BCV70DRAFT_88789 [Testicularia cyperi]
MPLFSSSAAEDHPQRGPKCRHSLSRVRTSIETLDWLSVIVVRPTAVCCSLLSWHAFLCVGASRDPEIGRLSGAKRTITAKGDTDTRPSLRDRRSRNLVLHQQGASESGACCWPICKTSTSLLSSNIGGLFKGRAEAVWRVSVVEKAPWSNFHARCRCLFLPTGSAYHHGHARKTDDESICLSISASLAGERANSD